MGLNAAASAARAEPPSAPGIHLAYFSNSIFTLCPSCAAMYAGGALAIKAALANVWRVL